jgi:hypothetical protein
MGLHSLEQGYLYLLTLPNNIRSQRTVRLYTFRKDKVNLSLCLIDHAMKTYFDEE